MLQTIRNAFKVKDLRDRLIYVFLMLVVFLSRVSIRDILEIYLIAWPETMLSVGLIP